MEDLQHYITDSHPHQTDLLGPRFLHRMYRKLWGCRYPGPFEWEVQAHAELVAAIEENGRCKPDSLHQATGVVITTWNRPQYLRPCLDSLARSHLRAITQFPHGSRARPWADRPRNLASG